MNNCPYYKKNGKCTIPHYEGNIKYTSCNCDEWVCAHKKLQQVYEIANKYKDLLKGAGGQSMNIMDRHAGMVQVSNEILAVLKG